MKSGIEPLEPRLALAAQFIISEFMASNTSGIVDQDGQNSDWIEIQNIGDSAGNLQGHYLSDNAGDLETWSFPSTPIAAGGFIRVFASGKNRAVAGQELHANFSLDANGEYLGLIEPNGANVVHDYDPYPAQLDNVSYGVLTEPSTDELVTAGANVRWHVPASDSLGTSWTTTSFDDSSWVSAALAPASTVVITEIASASPRNTSEDWLEIQNVTSETIDTSGWVVAIGESVTNINAVKSPIWTIGPSMSAGQVRYRTDLASDTANYFGVNISWANGANGRGWVMIVDAEGSVVDFAAFGWSAAEIAAMNTTVNGFAITPAKIAAAWSGGSLTGAGATNTSLQRRGNADTGTSSDWQWTTQTLPLGAQNSGLTTPFPLVQQAARTALGYERGSGYQSLIHADTESAMYDVNATAYMRTAFDVDLDGEAEIDFARLELRMRYDDGFVAYLNGVEVARRNAPGPAGTPPPFNADATAPREGALESIVETIDISSFVDVLQPGGNVLAIHGLNDAANDSDFLILPELVGVENTQFTENYFTTPTPGAANIPGTLGFVADTKFSVDRGFFEAPFQVAITSDTPGAQIRYTLDGAVPTATTGQVYTGPITITTTTTVRARAFKAGLTPTDADAQTYIKLSDVIRQSGAGLPPFANWGHLGPDWEMDQDLVGAGRPYANTIIDDLKSVPTLSLSMPWNDWFGGGGQGIYISGTAIERAVSAELINPDGSEGFQINAAVEVQGGTSDQRWKDDKLSLQLKFKRAYGDAELEYDFFGGDATDRFDTLILDSVLNYSWLHHQDGSQRENAKYIQDQFVADLQLAAGGAAPHGRFVHLYLNGLYWGMYYVHERPDENFAAEYLGGDDADYDIIKHASNRVVSGSNTNYLQLLNLAAQDLTIDANYQAMLGKLDIVPFIDYMLVNFYAGNTDWAHHNWYASFNRADPAGKWRFHSWDAEHVLKHHQSTTDVTGKNDAGSPTYLHQRLATNAEYRLLFADRVHKHFFNGGVMTPANAAAAYQARMNEVDRAIVGESVRWGDNGRATPYSRDADWFPDNQSLITGYFPARTNVVRGQLQARGLYTTVTPPAFNQHGGTITPPFALTMTAPAGAIYYTTDGSDPRLPGGAVSPLAQIYSGPVTLSGGTRVMSRVLAGGNWSALNEALFLLPTQPLRIVEVNYAPFDPPAGSPFAAGDFEYVELLNTGASAIPLAGFQISEGITYTFGNQTLAAGERIVVAKNLAAFQSRYGATINLATGVFTGSLNNAGEELRLTGALGETIQSFSYDNSGDWPGRADGNGSSLEIIDPLGDETDPDNWRSSSEFGGTPGAAGAGPIASIVVNEVLTHTDPPLLDAIEFYNPTESAIDLGGWYLSDDSDNYQKYRIPNGTMIQPGAYLVIDETQFGQGATGFGLNSSEGDDVWLLAADPATGKLHSFIDHVEFDAAANGESFGRWPNGAGDLYPMSSRTLGGANSGPRIGPVIISEVMYNAQGGNDDLEFVELFNITNQSIDLAGWKFTEGVDFTFGNTTIPARGTVVVLRFDPASPANADKLATFRAAYPGLPQNAVLAGGYAAAIGGGVLDNGGETVRLARPDAPEPGGLIPYLLVDEVDYDDDAPWPTSPDGTGPSLVRASQSVYGNEPSNWSGQVASPGIAELAQPLTTITGTSGNDTYYVVRAGAQLHIFENVPPIGAPTYVSEISSLGPDLTINTLEGDDTLTVDTGGQATLGLTQLIFNAGAGANILTLSSGSARIDSTLSASGTLNTTIESGAHLSTSRVVQHGLAIVDNSRLTLLPSGGTSVITSLMLSTDSTLDIGNNALVIDYTGASPVADLREKILSGRGGPGFEATWNGTGITSSAAAAANQTEPESRSLGYAENAALPLGPYTAFRGQPVDATSVLIAYTRTADANLDGVVNDDDVTVLGASYAPGVANSAWALGDFEYNGVIDDDDVTLLGAFYDPSAPPNPAPAAMALARSAEPAETLGRRLELSGAATQAFADDKLLPGLESRAQHAGQFDNPGGDDALFDLLAAAVSSDEGLGGDRPPLPRRTLDDLWADFIGVRR